MPQPDKPVTREQQILDQLLRASIEIDQLSFAEVDMLGLIEVAATLSKWRDNIG